MEARAFEKHLDSLYTRGAVAAVHDNSTKKSPATKKVYTFGTTSPILLVMKGGHLVALAHGDMIELHLYTVEGSYPLNFVICKKSTPAWDPTKYTYTAFRDVHRFYHA
jgi:hypothetical protein